MPQNCGPDRLSRFDVYWTQTNQQTDEQSIYIDGCAERQHLKSFFLLNWEK